MIVKTIVILALLLIIIFAINQKQHTFYVEREIKTALDSDILWSLLSEAFTDSIQSPIWPHQLETIESAALEEGGTARATYYLPFNRKSTLTYIFVAVNQKKSFQYQTQIGHPLTGYGTVSLKSINGGSSIIWQLNYQYQGISLAILFLRFYFLPRFFEALENNINRFAAEKWDN